MGQLKVLARFPDSVSLEVQIVDRIIDFRSALVNVLVFCTLYALYYRPNGLKWKDFIDQQETIECPDRVVRKEEHQWTLT